MVDDSLQATKRIAVQTLHAFTELLITRNYKKPQEKAKPSSRSYMIQTTFVSHHIKSQKENLKSEADESWMASSNPSSNARLAPCPRAGVTACAASAETSKSYFSGDLP